MSDIIVGSRVKHTDGYAGTVRYVGPLLTSSSIKHQSAQESRESWYGVEWDEGGHGKNSGTVDGHRYFDCPAGHGSLMKANKLMSGISLLQALTQRYTQHEDDIVCQGKKYRTTGADPFLRDAMTGAFQNVKHADCQANVELSCVCCAEIRASDAGTRVDIMNTNDKECAAWNIWDPSHCRVQMMTASVTTASSKTVVDVTTTETAAVSQCQKVEESADSTQKHNTTNSPSKMRRVVELMQSCRIDETDLCASYFPQEPIMGSLHGWFPNLQSLVLKGTLLASWEVVVDILQNLPRLEMLNISNTKLGTLSAVTVKPLYGPSRFTNSTTSPAPATPPCWSSTLRCIIASNTESDLVTMSYVIGALPNVEEVNFGHNPFGVALRAAGNHTAEMSCPFAQEWENGSSSVGGGGHEDDDMRAWKLSTAKVAYHNIQFLHLNDTGIHTVTELASWFDSLLRAAKSETPESIIGPAVSQGARTLRLQKLNLSENGITSIGLETTRLSPHLFDNVTSLWMRGCHFPSWDDFSGFIPTTFPNLNDLTFSDEDLLQKAVPGEVNRSHHHLTSAESSQFNQVTLGRFRFTVGSLPRQIQRLNNSTITEREIAAAERFALQLLLKPFVDFTEAHQRSPTAAELSCSPLMLAMVEKYIEEQKARSGSTHIFVPKPQFKRDEFAVHVVYAKMSYDEMCDARMKGGFEDMVQQHLMSSRSNDASLSVSDVRLDRDRHRTVIDVRWTVNQLRDHLLRVTGLEAQFVDPLKSFVGCEEDHWTNAEFALITTSLPGRVHREVLRKHIPVPFDKLFPKSSVLLFHYDMELAANRGAKDKGLHCKHLVRPSDKLYEHRVADGDAIVMISFA